MDARGYGMNRKRSRYRPISWRSSERNCYIRVNSDGFIVINFQMFHLTPTQLATVIEKLTEIAEGELVLAPAPQVQVITFFV